MTQIIKIEKRFLAYLLKDFKYTAMTIGKISSEFLPNYHWLYSLLLKYFQKYKGIPTDEVIDDLFAKRDLDKNTIITYKTVIAELRNLEINNDQAEFQALMDELEEYKRRKEILAIAENIANTSPLECGSKILENLEENLKSSVAKIANRDSDIREEGTLQNAAKSRLEKYKEIKANPELLKTVPTGFKHIDGPSGGFAPGELIYIIGRKGDGKSTLIVNLAKNMWLSGYNVLVFTLEVNKAAYERRFDANAANVSSNGLKLGRLTEEEETRYETYINNLERGLSPDGSKKVGIFYTVDMPAGCTPAYVDSKISILEQSLGIKFDVVATDYAGIMNPNIAVAEKRHQQGQIALDQKRIARTHNCILISAAQKSREGAKQKGSADSSFVAESDQVADHIDWGIDIASISDDMGIIQSFKTRDAEPFKFSFMKKYDRFLIQELQDNLGAWADLT